MSPASAKQRQLRHAVLTIAMGTVCITGMASTLRTCRTFVPGTSMHSAITLGAHGSRFEKPALQVRKVARRAADPNAMFQLADPSKLFLDPVLVAQCVAAIGLVLAGKVLLQKEEQEKEEKERELSAEPAKSEECEVQASEEYDIWRDSPLRYLGYSNELGEALRPVFPAAYGLSYAAAFAYVFADSLDKSGRADKKARMAAARRAFIEFDADCDGQLSKEEIKFALGKLKMPMSEQDLDAYFKKLDSITPNSYIDIEEFMAAYERRDQELTDLLELFGQADEKDGGLLANPSLVAGADALIWQVIASVALPGFTINRFVTLAENCCDGQPSPLAEYLPTALGLAMIPLICEPLDVLADAGLDATLRPILFASLDEDKSGTIEFSELSSKLQKIDAKFDEKYLRQLFDEIDVDKNGVITIEDWSNGGFQKYREAVERAEKVAA